MEKISDVLKRLGKKLSEEVEKCIDPEELVGMNVPYFIDFKKLIKVPHSFTVEVTEKGIKHTIHFVDRGSKGSYTVCQTGLIVYSTDNYLDVYIKGLNL